MAEAAESKEIIDELRAIRKDLDYIKDHIEELFLTPEEEMKLHDTEKEYKEGTSVSLAAFEKEMGA